MFLWGGGRRDRILFRNPSDLILRDKDLPTDVDEVWFADCCPPSMNDPAAGRPFRVFDHHVSNQRLFGHDPRCVFDMKRSGTSLMAHVMGLPPSNWSQHAQSLIEALEAYDLGRFDHVPGMRLADIATSYSQEEMLDRMHALGATDVLDNEAWNARAAAMSSLRNLYAESAVRGARFDTLSLGGDLPPMRVGIVSSPVYWKNECAYRILSSGQAELAVVVDITAGMVSLRSGHGGPDCSSIASMFGGGGHARAAGFRIGTHRMLATLSHEVLG